MVTKLLVPVCETVTDPFVVPAGRFAGFTVTVIVAGGGPPGCDTLSHPDGPLPKFALAISDPPDGPVMVTACGCDAWELVKLKLMKAGVATSVPLPLPVKVKVTGTVSVLLVPVWKNVMDPEVPDARFVEGSETVTLCPDVKDVGETVNHPAGLLLP